MKNSIQNSDENKSSIFLFIYREIFITPFSIHTKSGNNTTLVLDVVVVVDTIRNKD